MHKFVLSSSKSYPLDPLDPWSIKTSEVVCVLNTDWRIERMFYLIHMDSVRLSGARIFTDFPFV